MKIAYQGIEGSYSESCAKEMYPHFKTVPCKTFDDVFKMANEDEEVMAIIPESNRTTGNIGVEYLIFKYRLNIYEEKFYPINHCLLGVSGAKVQDIKNLYTSAVKNKSEITTLGCEIKDKKIFNKSNVVKVITDENISMEKMSRANTFSRVVSSNDNSNIYHHIGIYIYKVSILEKFVNLKPTKNELNNRLEQLRAIDNNIKIHVALASSSPIGVDTEEDYLALKKIMVYKS